MDSLHQNASLTGKTTSYSNRNSMLSWQPKTSEAIDVVKCKTNLKMRDMVLFGTTSEFLNVTCTSYKTHVADSPKRQKCHI